MTAAPKVPVVQRRRTERELARALWLRPRDIYEIYGISPSTLHELATRPDERRLPSRLIPGKSGRRGIRLVNRQELDGWLNRWSPAGEFTPAVSSAPRAA